MYPYEFITFSEIELVGDILRVILGVGFSTAFVLYVWHSWNKVK